MLVRVEDKKDPQQALLRRKIIECVVKMTRVCFVKAEFVKDQLKLLDLRGFVADDDAEIRLLMVPVLLMQTVTCMALLKTSVLLLLKSLL